MNNDDVINGEVSITTPSKKYVKFEIPKSRVLLETKDRLLVLLDNEGNEVIWVSKKIAKNFNEFKLSFFVSYCLDQYEGKDPTIQTFDYQNFNQDGKMISINLIHPLNLEIYFRKIG